MAPKPVLALHPLVTATSVKKRLMGSLTSWPTFGAAENQPQPVMQGAHTRPKCAATAAWAIASAGT
jgi:hypothetical protein